MTEGEIRFRMKRALSGREDSRRVKPLDPERYRAVIEKWVADYEDDKRSPAFKTRYEWLRRNHGLGGLYDAFSRHVKNHCIIVQNVTFETT